MGRSARQGIGHRIGVGLLGLILAGCGTGDRPASLFRPPPPTDVWAARVDEARRLVDEGLFDRARPLVERLIADRCPHAEVPFLRARLAFLDQDWTTAIAASADAMAASPAWIEPRILHARALLEARRFADAETVFADLEGAFPESAWGPYGRAAVAASRGDHDRARPLADRALGMEPRLVPALRLRASLARIAGDAATEEECLRRAVSADGGGVADLVRLGELTANANRRADADRWYASAYSREPSQALAKRLAALAREDGDRDRERHWTERAGLKTGDPP
jgi:tetratricopeptide (TPR) repeat protein